MNSAMLTRLLQYPVQRGAARARCLPNGYRGAGLTSFETRYEVLDRFGTDLALSALKDTRLPGKPMLFATVRET